MESTVIDPRIESYVRERAATSPAEFLTRAYAELLERGLDPAGYSHWLAKLLKGYDRRTLVARFLSSPERAERRLRADWPATGFAESLGLPPIPTTPVAPPSEGLEPYQDTWVRGACVRQGVRECAQRFAVILEFCRQYRRPFTVLDLGANLGYFSVRLAEARPCVAVAVEGVYGNWLEEVLQANAHPRVILLKRVVSLGDLRALAHVEHFDVILALGFVHHLEAEFRESMEVLRSLGDHLILELPSAEMAQGGRMRGGSGSAEPSEEGVLLGWADRPEVPDRRPILRWSRPKTALQRAYLGASGPVMAHTIHSDFERKEVLWAGQTSPRAWHPGINLQTYLWFGGAYPRRPELGRLLLNPACWAGSHRTVHPWDVVVQGAGLELIDRPGADDLVMSGDERCVHQLAGLLAADPADVASSEVQEALAQAEARRRVGLPVRWRGPVFNPSGYASEAINFLLPLGERATVGLQHHTTIYSERFVAGLDEADRQILFAMRDRFGSLAGGVAIEHNPANCFGNVADADYLVGRTMYETDRIPADWVAACNRMDEVWVPSHFNLETFAGSGVLRDKLVVVPGAVDDAVFDPRRYQPLPLPRRAAYNFLSIFEWSTRKAWDVLLAAYLREFSAEDDVCLYLRTYLFGHPDGDPSEELWSRIREFAATLALGRKPWPRIELLTEQLVAADLPRLYRAADCLVAATRGEGWGRPQHEAMMMGLPVIATGWSGNTEFMKADNSFLVDYELAEARYLEPELWQYRGHRWANPSESQLRQWLRWVQQHPAEARARGREGRTHVLRHFSRRPVADRVVGRLQAIERKLTTPACPAVVARALPPEPAPQRSTVTVAWEGAYLDAGSLSLVNRELTAGLSRRPQVRLTRVGPSPGPDALPSWPGRRELAARLQSRVPAGTQVTVRHGWPPRWDVPPSPAWVMIQPWEFGALPADWVRGLARVTEVWAYSEYVRRVYVDSGVDPAKVKVVPLGIDPARFRPGVEPMRLPTSKTFKFLFVGGTVRRKGIDVLLKAYAAAFRRQDDVCLVIKEVGAGGAYSGQTHEREIRELMADPDAPEIVYLLDELRPDELPSLYAAADALVHPYRGEGFGLPVLEAMACGLPVIVTAGGATDDFADDQHAYRLPACRQNLGNKIAGLELARNGWWLVADHDFLCERMRWVAANRAEAREVGRKASDYVRRDWTWDRAAAVVETRIRELVGQAEAASRRVASQPAPKPVPASLGRVVRVGNLQEARACLKAGRWKEAWEAAEAALRRRPYHPEAYLVMAEIAAVLGDGMKAEQCLRKARALAPAWKAVRQFRAPKPRARDGGEGWMVPHLGGDGAMSKPRLSVCLIVKNEERFLAQCLQSVKGLADQLVVVDTGSTDRTLEIARQHGAEVQTFEWCDDFSAARNASLELATGDWVLVLDADEELPADSHAALRRLMAMERVMAWRLPIMDVGREAEGCSYVPRLFRNAPGLFFVGRVHEQAFSSVDLLRQEWGLDLRLGDAVIRHHGYQADVVRERRKVERNLRLLERAVEESPDDPGLRMNLGLELCRSGQTRPGLEQYASAFRTMSALPPQRLMPETREMLLSQFCTHLMAVRSYDEIVRVLTSPLAKAGGLTASLHFSLGLAYLQLGKYQDAAAQMRLCLEKRDQPGLAPINPEIRRTGPRHCLALCLARLKETAAAREEFLRVLEEHPQSRPVRLDYAAFLARTGEPVEALKILHTLTVERPDETAVWTLGGSVALSRPEFLEVALDWTAEATRHLPEEPEVLRHRAEALLLAGQCSQSLLMWRSLKGRSASEQAVLILCELVAGEEGWVPGASLEEEVSQCFLRWYQRLVEYGAHEVVFTINQRVDRLRERLPRAARVLEAALAEASGTELSVAR